jgi:hypothetical protein
MVCDEIFLIFQIYKTILDCVLGNILQLGNNSLGISRGRQRCDLDPLCTSNEYSQIWFGPIAVLTYYRYAPHNDVSVNDGPHIT